MKYLLLLIFAFILISCDENTTDNPPVKKVETELLGTWSGQIKRNSDSIFFTVSFSDSNTGPVVSGEMFAKLRTGNGGSTTNIIQKGTIYYTYNKPNIALRFLSDSDYNGFIGVLSTDGMNMVGEVQPYDFLFGNFGKYPLTLTK